MSNLCELPAYELARLIRDGQTTSEAITQAHLDRIERLNPVLNVFLHVDADGALGVAREIDARIASGEKLGALAGVPIAVKDNFCTRGMPTTCGSRMLEG